MNNKSQIIPKVPMEDIHSGHRANRQVLSQALQEVGACELTLGGPLAAGIFSDLTAATISFFNQSLATKQEVALTRNGGLRGYVGHKEERTNGIADLKESFEFAQNVDATDMTPPFDRLCGLNVWPDAASSPNFRPSIESYLDAIDTVGQAIFDTIVTSVETELTRASCDALRAALPSHFSRLIHYSHPSGVEERADRLVAHTDHAFFSLIFQNAQGLEIRLQDGSWVTTEPNGQSIVVFTGEVVEAWGGGRFKSCLHRVRNASLTSARISISTFFLPNLEAIVHPLPSADANSPSPAPSFRVADREIRRMNEIFAASRGPVDP